MDPWCRFNEVQIQSLIRLSKHFIATEVTSATGATVIMAGCACDRGITAQA